MDDREVVAAIAAGDPAGIAVAYDRYAAALYGYCHWKLRQPTDAAEATQDTFVIAAAALGDLPEAPKPRLWLYWTARKVCQRRLRTNSATRGEEADATDQRADTGQQAAAAGPRIDAANQPIGGVQPIRMARQPTDPRNQLIDATQQFRAASQLTDATQQSIDTTQQFRVINPSAATADHPTHVNNDPEQADLPTLVRGILAELAPSEFEVIELNLRHDLYGADLATALGVSVSRASAMSSRAHEQLEKALGVLLIARTGREACPALDELLVGWDGQLTEQTRDLVGGHVEQCEVCVSYRWGALRPVALSGLLPLAPLPPGLREKVLSLCWDTTPDAVAYRRRVARRAGLVGSARFSKATRLVRLGSTRGAPRPSNAAVATAVWVMAVWAVCMTLLIFAGSRPSHAPSAQPTVRAPSSSPAAASTIAVAPATVPTSVSVKPSPPVSRPSAVVTPSIVPSAAPTESAEPSPSSSSSPTNSSSSKPSKSPSPSSSPSRKPSPSPSPSRS